MYFIIGRNISKSVHLRWIIAGQQQQTPNYLIQKWKLIITIKIILSIKNYENSGKQFKKRCLSDWICNHVHTNPVIDLYQQHYQ